MVIDSVNNATMSQANSLNMQDFLKILLTQLNYQDPMKPVDNQQFMAQLAQFTSLEQTQKLNTKIDQLISTQAALQSVGLIGRMVDITDTSGSTVTGTVKALSLSGDSPQLTVLSSSGETLTGISLAQIAAVR
ncbi:flagellar hook capping protein [Herbaspirillum sp. WGmk3]|uniref:flagellar hook capping FlgD N-terminal domain-containing protein n=1 Tax=Herbaspirillum sp. WGmk3 TaxID=2919925 RepID=UPI00209087CB|nr:flagellar hook capping FlgD N-terminal domain-containing protein [Herbaspirillum sp. WGmk3]MCO4855927.1 flagellar hook capping protein [Herbaspirillum sp. WGmk3]